jgi:uncharacterized protein (DUF433 family)
MGTTLLNRITTNLLVLTGKPVIRNMRISVEQILKMLSRKIHIMIYSMNILY